jgi:hypothetical protein
VLTTALNYSNIAEFLDVRDEQYPDVEANDENLEKLAKWIFERGPSGRTRLGESRNLRFLSAIVESEKALESFERGESIQEAAMFTEMPLRIFRRAVDQSKKKLQTAWSYLYKVEGLTEEDARILSEILRLAKDASNIVRDRLVGE